MGIAHRVWLELLSRTLELETRARDRDAKLELLRYQAQELEALKLVPGELEALAEEHAFQCGYCTPAMALRASALLAAFVLFRALDIWKPPPVRQLEALPGGIGIVADDVMAGLYGALAIFVLDRFRFF